MEHQFNKNKLKPNKIYKYPIMKINFNKQKMIINKNLINNKVINKQINKVIIKYYLYQLNF